MPELCWYPGCNCQEKATNICAKVGYVLFAKKCTQCLDAVCNTKSYPRNNEYKMTGYCNCVHGTISSFVVTFVYRFLPTKAKKTSQLNTYKN